MSRILCSSILTMSKNDKIEKNNVEKMETNGNKSKIGKGGQDCMTIIFWRSQIRLGGNMSKKGKKGKIEKKIKNWRPTVIRVR